MRIFTVRLAPDQVEIHIAALNQDEHALVQSILEEQGLLGQQFEPMSAQEFKALFPDEK